MKRRSICIFLAVLLCGLLCSCGQTLYRPTIQVSLVESDDYYIEENGIRISPGQNVRFSLQLRAGSEVVGLDYDGDYYIWKENGVTKVELRNVRYPVRATPQVTRHYRSVTYDPNGGTGQAAARTYDISLHTRPNTALGTDIFERQGYTLTCWNTAPDGSGTRVGLGSRVTVPEEGLTLYAQWAPWNSVSDFGYTLSDGAVTITAYRGSSPTAVIPEAIENCPVTAIAAGAFSHTAAQSVILPKTMVSVSDGAFANSALTDLLLFDNIESISDAAFAGCTQLQTLHINAVEAPYGYAFRRESMYADKIDMMIQAQGKKKAVFYAGCSMWYNLNGEASQNALPDYVVINAAINGTVSSYVQMQILGHFLEPGDIFFHTPELSSREQLLIDTDMGENDEILWAGLEYNYDLFALVDIRGLGGVFDTFCEYLASKKEATDYRQQYTDDQGRVYLDATGSIPFSRTVQNGPLAETELVNIDPEYLRQADLSLLAAMYRSYMDRGVTVCISHACVDFTALPQEQQDAIGEIDQVFRSRIEAMDGPVVISTLWDFLYDESQFYGSAFHLLSPAVDSNTAIWLRDLRKFLAENP